MSTIAQQLDFKDFPLEIKDKNGKVIYYEESSGYWEKLKYDSNSKLIHHENSNGFWEKIEYDSEGNFIPPKKSGKIIQDLKSNN